MNRPARLAVRKAAPDARRGKPRWHFETPAIPVRAAVLSAASLAVPVVGVIGAGGAAPRFEALLWMAAMVPCFLLAYYRGWIGVATGLATGMAIFSLVQVFLIQSGQRLPDWPFMLSISAALVGLSFVVGGVTDRLHAERERAERLALFDPLTGLANRRYLELIAAREFAAAQRGRLLTLVAFDLDGLKEVNDGHGHKAGDDMIRAFGAALEQNTRSMNLSARVGGDEFISVLSAADVEGTMVFVRRVQAAAAAIQTEAGAVSVSAGVVAYSNDFGSIEELLAAADAALYRAKSSPGSVAVFKRGATLSMA